MKKLTLILLAVFVLALGAFAARDQTPPPVRPAPPAPVANAVPSVAAAPIAEARPAEQAVPVKEPVTAAPVAPAATAETTPQVAPTPAAVKSTPKLRTELIRLKYADIETVTNLLRAYASSFGRVPRPDARKTRSSSPTFPKSSKK